MGATQIVSIVLIGTRTELSTAIKTTRFNGPPWNLDANNPDSDGDGMGDKQEVWSN